MYMILFSVTDILQNMAYMLPISFTNNQSTPDNCILPHQIALSEIMWQMLIKKMR